jgi:hypothetical protein
MLSPRGGKSTPGPEPRNPEAYQPGMASMEIISVHQSPRLLNQGVIIVRAIDRPNYQEKNVFQQLLSFPGFSFNILHLETDFCNPNGEKTSS